MSSFLVPLCIASAALPSQATSNGAALVPPMGWNSWNAFGCAINEEIIKSAADNLVSLGLQEAGYEYVVVDDCWAGGRDAGGNLVGDANFPSGMAALAAYVHARGLKFGLYLDAGTATCAGRPGSLGHERQDASTLAAWGVDYIKEDWCHTEGLESYVQYAKMRDAIALTGRPIAFSLCSWGQNEVASWGAHVGNMWRISEDIRPTYDSIWKIAYGAAPLAPFSGPGGWNDLDMLEVGNAGISELEARTHFSLWAMAATPLMAGTDLTKISNENLKTLLNKEVIAVGRDPKGRAAFYRSDDAGEHSVWYKPLSSGGVAILLFNKGETSAVMTADFRVAGLQENTTYPVRDTWQHIDLGPASNQFTANQVPPHGAVMLVVGPPPPSVWPPLPVNDVPGSTNGVQVLTAAPKPGSGGCTAAAPVLWIGPLLWVLAARRARRDCKIFLALLMSGWLAACNTAPSLVWNESENVAALSFATPVSGIAIQSAARSTDVLDVNYSNATSLAVSTYRANGGNNQRWTFERGKILADITNLCLDVARGDSAAAKSGMAITTCDAARTTQQWSVRDNTLVAGNGQCLTAPVSAPVPQPLTLAPCDAARIEQRWYISTTVFTLRLANAPELCLTLRDDNVTVETCNLLAGQLWSFDGTQAVANGRCLDAPAGQLRASPCTGSMSQKWTYERGALSQLGTALCVGGSAVAATAATCGGEGTWVIGGW